MNILRSYLPTTRASRVFSFSALVDASGNGLYLAGSAIFFVRSIGLTNAQVGFGLSVGMLAAFIATVPLGLIARYSGARRLLVLLHIARGIGMCVLAFTSSFLGFLVVSIYLAVAQSATGPMTQAVAAAGSSEQDRVHTMAVLRAMRNVGFSLGALAAVPLLDANSVWGYRAIILGNAVSFFIAAIITSRLQLVREPKPGGESNLFRVIVRFRDSRYLAMTGLNGIIVIHSTLLSVGIPLSVVRASRAPADLVPLLTLLNTLFAVVLQIQFARLARTPKGAARSMRLATLALAACCITMAFVQYTGTTLAIVLLISAMVFMSMGELWQSAGSWEISYRYAPEDEKPTYLSIFFLGITGQSVIGPLVFTTLIIGHGMLPWIIISVVQVSAGAAMGKLLAAMEQDGLTNPADVSSAG